jgi:hypothetical protein
MPQIVFRTHPAILVSVPRTVNEIIALNWRRTMKNQTSVKAQNTPQTICIALIACFSSCSPVSQQKLSSTATLQATDVSLAETAESLNLIKGTDRTEELKTDSKNVRT